ncbi:General transcription factor II-I repeat domain-containing protein 2 [Frankliniella fusca]|uniref:General transcription factor II-I repeat domain-containing protein 2 n=1 Tax=Frankliniella fusca TaxID=407009 RepID=A0AAE1LGI7_9NEOP|nr:General transcription factor II-I repeat domain-containing protein 2 [Frankliniella fusca]
MEWFGLSWTKFVAMVTDGALAMAGDVKDGLVFRVRNYLKSLGLPSDFPLIHCIIHQEALCAKTLPVDNVMGVMVMVKAVNKIRAHALNHADSSNLSLLKSAVNFLIFLIIVTSAGSVEPKF